MISKIILLFLIVTSYSYADISTVQNWVKSNSISSDLDGELPKSIFASLKEDTKAKKFVFLGEPDHYHLEKYQYRLMFMKSLLKLGYRKIYGEMGVADAKRVNLYLSTGNEDYLNQVGLYGFKYGNPLKDRKTNYTIEEKRFWRKVLKLKRVYPDLEYAGFDLDIYPSTAYLDLDKYFLKKDFKNLRKKNSNFRKAYELINNSKLDKKDISKRFKKINEAYSLAKSLGTSARRKVIKYSQFLFELKTFKDSLYFRKDTLANGYSINSFAWREKRMFEIMTHVFKHESPREKYILFGHNGHLSKSSKFVKVDGDEWWYVIGAWINKQYKNQIFAVWSLMGSGEHSGHGCPDNKRCSFTPLEGTFEEALFNIFPTENIYFKNSEILKENEEFIVTTVNGNSRMTGKHSLYTDAFFFMPVVQDVNP